MHHLNQAILSICKRAENYQRGDLIASYVDVGHIFTILSTPENQVLFGRRGTGKTHVFAYLGNQVASRGETVVQLDLRTLGSSGGIYSDPNLPLSQRATRLLADTLQSIHDAILDSAVEDEEDRYDLATIAPHLDRFLEAASEVAVVGPTETEQREVRSQGNSTSYGAHANVGLEHLAAAAGARSTAQDVSSQETATRQHGPLHHRIHFGQVVKEFKTLLAYLPSKSLWLLLDEWSEIPLDLQPYLADLLRRTVFVTPGIKVKIAAIEHRCQFRIPDSDSGHIGIEIGADVAASVNLDEFLVFEADPARSKHFFRDLLHKHVATVAEDTRAFAAPANPSSLINDVFTQVTAFEEFVRAAEGNPRDGINILGQAVLKAGDGAISVPNIREGARSWYVRDKLHNVAGHSEAQELLNWVLDEVIKHRQARAFLVRSELRDPLLEFLYDARVLHIIKKGVSGHDQPGKRFDVYALDYGCYVELISTAKAPKGLLPLLDESQEQVEYIDVPQTDHRSIRRAILDLDDFYRRPEQS